MTDSKKIGDDLLLNIKIDPDSNTYVCRWRVDLGDDIGPYVQEQGLAIVLGWGMDVTL